MLFCYLFNSGIWFLAMKGPYPIQFLFSTFQLCTTVGYAYEKMSAPGLSIKGEKKGSKSHY